MPTTPQPQALLYEGKGKKLFTTENPREIIAEFKDDLTAFNAKKRSSEEGKGELNCLISSLVFDLLARNGVKSHFIRSLSPTTMLCHSVQIIPIEVVVRNVATGSLSKRLGIADGLALPFTLVEFYYKNDTLNDPLINDEHCKILGLIKEDSDLDFLREEARKINAILRGFFDERGLRLIDFKLEFGRDAEGQIILADEISPDSCRFWDKQSNAKLDKDRFRENLGDVKDAYAEVLRRMQS